MGMAQQYNTLASLIKNYLLPLPMDMTEGESSQELFHICAFRGTLFLGTYHTIEARRASVNTEATKLYDTAARNFGKAAEISSQAIELGFSAFRTKKALADSANNYATGLASITRGNPDYATRTKVLDQVAKHQPISGSNVEHDARLRKVKALKLLYDSLSSALKTIL